MSFSRRELIVLALAAALTIVVWLLTNSYPGYDTYYHLVWGREIFAGQVPTIDAYQAPTAHPLYLLLAAILGATVGDDSAQLMVLICALSLVVCAWAIWRIGRVVFGAWPGIVAALLVATNLTLILYAARGFADMPFLALIFVAAALEGERKRRGASVLVLLAAAGLLRPEAWLLAGIYWLWCCWPKDHASGRRSPHLGLLALVLVAPLLWGLFDWWEVGQPLYALTATSSLAAELGRERGIAKVPATFIDALVGVLRTPQLMLVGVGILIEIFRRSAKSFYLPLGLIATGILTFICVGIFGLSLLPRYLTIPSITLLLFAGYALAGWVQLGRGSWLRRGWALAALVVVIAGAALTVQRADSFRRADVEIRYISAVHNDLEATLADPKVVAALRCGPLSLPAFGLIPESLWIRNSAAGSVVARADVSPTSGVAIVFVGDKTHHRYGRADGVPIDTDFAPRGFKLIATHGRISAWARCR
ncbi:MAG: glycosyltransferase family 39 protein [Solirubrobacterales bacterium]|nr:glycosyltransferase family 39 protein [Solirubrobacterales bacterium]